MKTDCEWGRLVKLWERIVKLEIGNLEDGVRKYVDKLCHVHFEEYTERWSTYIIADMLKHCEIGKTTRV